jgi:predicted RecA/RadA family phage recombinase
MAKVATRVQKGDVIDIVLIADVNGGDPVDFGSRVGIASTGGKAGETIALQIEEVFQFTAVDADVIVLGTKMYVDSTGLLATTDNSTNRYIGEAVTEKAGGVAGTVNVKLGV